MKTYIAENTTATTHKLLTLGHRQMDCVKDSEKLLGNFASAWARGCVLQAFLVKCMEYDLANSCWQLLRFIRNEC